jgi:hypothetical protein
LVIDDDFVGFADGTPLENGVVGVDRFATIQSASTASTAGDTLLIEAGTYAESVHIDRSLIVQANGSVVISPPVGADGIRITAGDVTLQGITIRDARNGVYSTTTGTLILLDLETLDNSHNGVRADFATSIAIADLTATGNGRAGIRVQDLGNVVLTGAIRTNDNVRAGLDAMRTGSVSIETGIFSGMTLRDVDSLTTTDQTIISTSSVLITARNSIELNGTINAQSHLIAIHANSDGAGSESLIMSPDSRLLTTNESSLAISLAANTLLGGVGSIHLAQISAGGISSTTSGIIVSAIGGAIIDSNESLDNITAANAVLVGQRGVGIDQMSTIPFNPIDTRVSRLSGAGGTGGFYIDNYGLLELTSAISPSAIRTMGSADVEIEASGALTVSGDVSVGGRLELRSRDSYETGDDLIIRTGADISANGPIVLDAGDDVRVEPGSHIESLKSKILIQLDGDNFDEQVGSVAIIDGIIDSFKGTKIVGGRDEDQIHINQVGVGGFLLDGSTGDDVITINYPSLPVQFQSEIVVDDSGGGQDTVIVNATPEVDEIFLTSSIGPASRNAERLTRINDTNEPISIRDSIDDLQINTGDSADIAHIQPSTLFRVFVDGGGPCFGHPGVPLGDVPDFQPLGNQFAITDRAFVAFGPDTIYPPVQFSGFETLPVTELGTGAPQLFDFNHTNTSSSVATSPTQPGYTSVRPDTFFADGLGYGWQTPVSSFERNDGFYDGPQAALIQDGHSLGENATFSIEVPTTGYYYFSALIGSPYTDISDIKIRNEDAQRIIVEDIYTLAGESSVIEFVAYTSDGTIDITFINSRETPTIWGLNSLSMRPAQLLTMGLDTCDTPPLLADGVTVDSFTLHGAEPNALVTVSATMGTIRNIDVDDEIRGMQIQADANGQATVDIQRGFGLGTSFIKMQDVQGRGLGHATLDYIPPNQRYLDFNHVNRISNSVPSPTLQPNATPANPNGFVGVLPTDIYTPGSGFGWLTTADSFDNGEFVNDPRGDFNRDGAIGDLSNSFFVELPNDTYDVTITMGTLQDLDGLRLRANDRTILFGGETGAAEYLQMSFQVEVTDNLLTLVIGNSGLLPNWAMNGVEIRSANLVTPITFDSNIGSRAADGMNSVSVTATTQAEPGEQITVATTLGTITTPDVNPEFLGIRLVVPASGAVSFDVLAPMHSGVPELTAKSLDGRHQGSHQDAAFLSWFVPVERRFDFNHVNNGWEGGESPTAAGAIGVTRLDRAAEVDGFGWRRAPNSYDNRPLDIGEPGAAQLITTGDIHQDYAGGHASTGGRTFFIEVKPGVDYDVRAFTGSRHKDQSIQIRVEGTTAVQSVATTAGVYSALTFFNAHDTNGDNMLEVGFGNAGELSFLWMVNGVDISESAIGLPATSPLLLAEYSTHAASIDARELDSETLDAALVEAIGIWTANDSDLTEAARLRIAEVSVVIEDLDSVGALGLAGSRHIVLDDNALGQGWRVGESGTGTGIDLGAVLLHELGHILGLPDLDPTLHADELMSGSL